MPQPKFADCEIEVHSEDVLFLGTAGVDPTVPFPAWPESFKPCEKI